MTNNTEQQAVPAAQERESALATAFCLLDTFAGEGLGHVYGNGQQIDADTTVFALCTAFDMEPEDGWYRTLAAELAPLPLPCKSGEGAGEIAKLDWTRPVEAIHTSGQIDAVRIVQQGRGEPHAFALVEFAKQYWGCTENGSVTAYGWRIRNVAALTPDATQTREAEGPRLMSDEAKTGERVLVHFTGKGWLTVTWEDPHGDGDYKIWCVDDDKHGPYALRGYREGDDTHWLPLSALPALKARDAA